MKRNFEIYGRTYTITPCTAIASCDNGSKDARQSAILVSWTADSGERFEYIVFGYAMPETTEDFSNMCNDTTSWESDWTTLETVRTDNQ